MRQNEAIFDPKPCPKRAQNEGSSEGSILSVDTLALTNDHAALLNRRPLHPKKGWFDGICRLFNDIRWTIPAFLTRKVGKSHPESVPKACLSKPLFRHPDTNLLRRIRFTSQGQADLERAARDELRQFAFRRQY